MPNYKDQTNNLHFIESVEYEYLLPVGCVAITDSEAAAIRASVVSISPTIDSISALQGLLAIDQAGLSAAYEAWASDPARTFAERAFINKAQAWRRDDPTLNAAAATLGLSGEQVDALFALAATL